MPSIYESSATPETPRTTRTAALKAETFPAPAAMRYRVLAR